MLALRRATSQARYIDLHGVQFIDVSIDFPLVGHNKLWLIIGLIQEAMTDAQRANMLAHMPPPVLDFWTNVGKGQFEAFIADVRR